ncbi:hypothetical protein GO497_22035 [Acidovorax citrulli]|nr:hypothetical protein [Paracidovorax citrulli]
MTNITSPPAIDALPPAPLPTDTPADFNSKGFATVAAQVNMVPQINAVAANVFQNATAAQERATAAAGSATTAGTQATNAAAARAGAEAARDTAITQAGNASASATAASASALQVDKRYLGAKASAPTTDNQGAALQAGAVYYNTSTNKVMTWSGSAWVDGISAVAGVSSVNGRSGAVTLSGSDLPTLAPKVSPSFAGIVSYTGALRGNALEMGDLVVDCNHSNYFSRPSSATPRSASSTHRRLVCAAHSPWRWTTGEALSPGPRRSSGRPMSHRRSPRDGCTFSCSQRATAVRPGAAPH